MCVLGGGSVCLLIHLLSVSLSASTAAVDSWPLVDLMALILAWCKGPWEMKLLVGFYSFWVIDNKQGLVIFKLFEVVLFSRFWSFTVGKVNVFFTLSHWLQTLTSVSSSSSSSSSFSLGRCSFTAPHPSSPPHSCHKVLLSILSALRLFHLSLWWSSITTPLPLHSLRLFWCCHHHCHKTKSRTCGWEKEWRKILWF